MPARRVRKFSTSKLAPLALVALVALFLSYGALSSQPAAAPQNAAASATASPPPEFTLDDFANNVANGGIERDAIRSIDGGRYSSTGSLGGFLTDGDVVFVLTLGNASIIYPQKVMVWHEIVNDALGDLSFSVTYSPLTGSAAAYMGFFNGTPTSFGTSGLLVNDNTLMYDRNTGSYWPQLLGVSIAGALKGNRLAQVPLSWTTWGKARALYTNALVLTQPEGSQRPYGQDPYGSYASSGNYYDLGEPAFPIMYRDTRLPSKEPVIAMRLNGIALAISKKSLSQQKAANLNFGDLPAAALYNDRLDDAFVFSRRVGDRTLTFAYNNGWFVDQETSSVWTPNGNAVSGPLTGTQLEWLPSFNVMWFAWSSFYPTTALYA